MSFVFLPHRIEYEWIGPGPGEAATAVLLHHGLGSVSAWRDFPHKIAEHSGLGVLVYSRRGYGRSARVEVGARPVDFMQREARGDLPRLLAALEVKSPHLIGHSDGASIAILYSGSELQPRPRSLLLMSPHVFVEDVTVESAGRAAQEFERGPLREGLARHHEDPDGAFVGWSETWRSREFRSWNIESSLKDISCPVTVVQGEDDEYGTVRQVDAIRRGLAAEPSVVALPHCGHLPYREAEPEALRAILDHLGVANPGSLQAMTGGPSRPPPRER